jgi:ElaB/YqjD/DUF883 family membrane-anchored ribosome-binding protein
MTTTSNRVPSPEYPFPAEDGVVVAHAVGRAAEVAAEAREQLADAAVQAQAHAEAFRDTAADYIRCYPFRAVIVTAALGFLLGLARGRLPR